MWAPQRAWTHQQPIWPRWAWQSGNKSWRGCVHIRSSGWGMYTGLLAFSIRSSGRVVILFGILMGYEYQHGINMHDIHVVSTISFFYQMVLRKQSLDHKAPVMRPMSASHGKWLYHWYFHFYWLCPKRWTKANHPSQIRFLQARHHTMMYVCITSNPG